MPNDGAIFLRLGTVPGVKQVEAVKALVDGHPSTSGNTLVSERHPKRVDGLVLFVAFHPKVADASLYGVVQVVDSIGVVSPPFQKLNELMDHLVRGSLPKSWDELAEGHLVRPNVRAKLAPTVGRAGPVGENVQRTADRARVARRWGSA